MEMTIPQNKLNFAILDLLIDLHGQVQSLKSVIAQVILDKELLTEDELLEIISKVRESEKDRLINQIKTHYSKQNIDDALGDLFKD